MANTTAQLAQSTEKPTHEILYYAAVLLAVVGLGISIYMTYIKVADQEAACVETGSIDCGAVQNSIYSEIAGIPIGVLGILGYGAILGVLALENRVEFVTDYGRTAIFMMTLIGTLYSAYLTYVEAFVLEKWCIWCVGSALAMVGLFAIAIYRVIDMFNEYDELE